jgi:SAM-dependent methyltransferase
MGKDSNTEPARVYYDALYEPSSSCKYIAPEEEVRRAEVLRGKTQRWFGMLGVCTRLTTVIELGCGNGVLKTVHPGWVGVDLSYQACKNVVAGGGRGVNGDLEHLPLADGSVDAIISWAALEHVNHPSAALEEIVRVLRPGGFLILGASWNCRFWTVKRLRFRAYASLSLRLRIEKATIPARNLLLWRALCALPTRMRGEISLLLRRPAGRLSYRCMVPQLDATLPHVSDDDAFASIDAHAAICYFVSRGWSCVSHPSAVRRLLVRHEEVVLTKLATNEAKPDG